MQNANLLLYINLSGEVFYIIAHRMRSQNVTEDLRQRVYNDLALAICHPTVIQNLLKGSLQLLGLNLADVRILMDRIVHSSIMTVNTYSMEKLFELTLIATKYQYTVCQFPTDILLIALNHLDSIRKGITDSIAIQMTENLHRTLVGRLKDVNARCMQDYRYAILTYLADVKLKMTNLIRLGAQKPSGEFVKELSYKVLRAELVKPGTMEYDEPVGKNSSQSENEDEYTDDPEEDDAMKDRDDIDEKGVVKPEEQNYGDLYEDVGCHYESVPEDPDTNSPNESKSSKDTPKLVKQFEVGTEFPELLEKSTDACYTVKFIRGSVNFEDESSFLSHSLELNGHRGISLGLSIYEIPGNSDEEPVNNDATVTVQNESNMKKVSFDESLDESETTTTPSGESITDAKAVQGLDLCSILLGCKVETDNSAQGQYSNVLSSSAAFSDIDNGDKQDDNDKEGQSSTSRCGVSFIRFDARTDRSGSKAALAKLSREFEAEEKSESEIADFSKTNDPFLNFTMDLEDDN